MSFGSQLGRFSKKAIERATVTKRSASLELFSAIVKETPVDKGVLRNNWFANIGSGSVEVTGEGGETSAPTIAKIKQIVNEVELPEDLYLTNNLPYASTIEFDGHSKKARQGMVRVNVARWDKMVTRAARRSRRDIP